MTSHGPRIRIAIASGKGGTGKTTVATNLAAVAGPGVCYADCDVEEPNGHLFLHPEIETSHEIATLVPRVDPTLCDSCGDCSAACRFNAIAVLPKSVMIFDELCHGCGGCVYACKTRAIHEEPRPIGVVETGRAGTIDFVQGRLNVGEPMSPPLIRAVKNRLPQHGLILLDAPPGTSCPVIAAMHDTDFCVLVTEPTPFGLNDLVLAVELVRTLGLPHGIVINRDGIGDDKVEVFCREQGVPILARIPDSREVAEAYSRGEIAVDVVPGTKRIFQDLLAVIWKSIEQSGRMAI
jgi:MinD superfamily P-loop ATPase